MGKWHVRLIDYIVKTLKFMSKLTIKVIKSMNLLVSYNESWIWGAIGLYRFINQ